MESTDKSVGRAVLLIVISALSFGSISVLTVLITREHLPLITAMAWRYFLAGVILGLLIRPFRSRVIKPRQILQLMLIGGVGQALITYISLHALEYIAVGPLAFLFYTYPAWVALLAAIRKTEKLTRTRIVALVLALVGVSAMVGAPSAEALNPVGVALALASAILYALYLPALAHLQASIPAAVSAFLIVLGAALSFSITALFTNQIYLPKGTAAWANIV